MKTLDKYIAGKIFSQFVTVMFVLIALFVFIDMVAEMSQINKTGYGMWQVFQYVIFRTPRIIYELFPMGALIGAILGLSSMAKDSELVVMRAAGVSIRRIVYSTLKVGAVLAIIAMLIGEVIAPYSETRAIRTKAEALQSNIQQQSDFGLWMRDDSSYITIGEILPDLTVLDIKIFEFDEQRKLRNLSSALSGNYDKERGSWVLNSLQSTLMDVNKVEVGKVNKAIWDTEVSPAILKVFKIQPDQLSIGNLRKYINHLTDNNQVTTQYELSFWNKIFAPISIFVMLILAVPFVFRQVRSGALTKGLVSGIMLGLGFFILNKAFSYFVILFSIPPVIGALIPSLIVFGVSMFLMRELN